MCYKVRQINQAKCQAAFMGGLEALSSCKTHKYVSSFYHLINYVSLSNQRSLDPDTASLLILRCNTAIPLMHYCCFLPRLTDVQYVTCRAQMCTEPNRNYPFFGYIDISSLVVQDDYIFIQVGGMNGNRQL